MVNMRFGGSDSTCSSRSVQDRFRARPGPNLAAIPGEKRRVLDVLFCGFVQGRRWRDERLEGGRSQLAASQGGAESQPFKKGWGIFEGGKLRAGA